MSQNQNVRRKGPARANTLRLLSNDYFNKSRKLLEELGDIPILNFASFWDYKYEESIDFVQLGHPEGLVGFLRDHSHRFGVYSDKDGVLKVGLIPDKSESPPPDDCGEQVKENMISLSSGKHRPIDGTIDRLFDGNNSLWANHPWAKCLNQKNIFIASSSYELAFDVNRANTTAMVRKFRAIFAKYPSGVPITQIYKLVNVQDALTTFNVSISIVTLIDELPEIFYRAKMPNGCDDLVLSGFDHSIQDLTGHDDVFFLGQREPDVIVTDAINSGMYQKTLLLIKEAGQIKGLKINVWQKSIKENFYPKNERQFENDIADFSPLTYFLALARYDLVELRSSEDSKNDIRAHLPRKYIDLMDLRASLSNLINPDSNSEGPEDNSDALTQGVPESKHVDAVRAILKSQN